MSAELCFGWPAQCHQPLRELAISHGLDLRVIAYLRPPLDWMASALSQALKLGKAADHSILKQLYSGHGLARKLGMVERLEVLADVYGHESLVLRPFLRQSLVEGCVVRDFCALVGMSRSPRRIHHHNQSLSLPGSQCLHRRNQALGRPLRGPRELLSRDGLIDRLQRLFPGPPSLRLHSAVLGDLAPFVYEQLDQLQRHFGLE